MSGPHRFLATPRLSRVRLVCSAAAVAVAAAAGPALLVVIGFLTSVAALHGSWRLARPDFVEMAAQGFGDRQNSFPWAMTWWRGALYVGTNRAYSCTAQWALNRSVGAVLFPYPPTDPDVSCAADPADLPLQAEIWRWTPDSETWTRLYRSPADLPNPDRPGKWLPREMGFRTMTVHVEPDGTEALYVGGFTTQMMWAGKVPPPRLLRSLDGQTFSPVPQDAGTVFGTLPKASLRTLTSYDDRLFVINGDAQGGGIVFASSDPAAGGDAWMQVTPAGLRVFEMHVFNGWLYLGTVDPAGGYAVVKTQAAGEPPFTFVPVIERGGFLTPPSDGVLSMHVFKNRLRVGTGTVFFPIHEVELVRINPDDSWDLVMGNPRQTPGGWKFPLTGIGDGFANGFNDHIWRMHASGDNLFIATYDSSTEWKVLRDVLPQVEHLQGFDLYRTSDDWYVTPLSTDGFGDPFAYGVRNFADTPFGLIFGAANPYYGLRIWRGVAVAPPPVGPPQRLEVENVSSGVLLSWQRVAGAARYVVQRTRMRTVANFPTVLGNPRIPGVFADLAATARTVYLDPAPLGEYLYVVLAETTDGARSTSSNIVQVPSRLPPVQFTTVLSMIDSLDARGLFATPQAAGAVRAAVGSARTAAESGNLAAAAATLQAVQRAVADGGMVQFPQNEDLEIVLGKLARRLMLASSGLLARHPFADEALAAGAPK